MKLQHLHPRTLFRLNIYALPTLALAALLILPSLALGREASPQSASKQVAQSNSAQQTPSDVVREFFKLMRERRYREAFMISIFRPAVEELSPQEMEDLRPDFERMALEAPETVVLTGEQMSGDEATVFMRLDDEGGVKVVPVFLIREKNGPWIFGDRENQKVVRKRGKKFFFEARIDAHHDDVENMMRRIATAQLVYSSQHNGAFGDLNALVKAGFIPQDILQTASTGYRFHVTTSARGYSAGAEPAVYGRTGRLSFYLDQTGVLKKEDKGGKPLKGS